MIKNPPLLHLCKIIDRMTALESAADANIELAGAIGELRAELGIVVTNLEPLNAIAANIECMQRTQENLLTLLVAAKDTNFTATDVHSLLVPMHAHIQQQTQQLKHII